MKTELYTYYMDEMLIIQPTRWQEQGWMITTLGDYTSRWLLWEVTCMEHRVLDNFETFDEAYQAALKIT